MNIIDIEPYDIYSTLVVKDSVPAPHIKEISDLLMDTVLNDNKPDRLTVSQPPRTGKSSLITLSFPFWLIFIKPELNILIVNYSQTLADDFGMKLRQLFIDHKDFLAQQDIYLSDKQRSKSNFIFENRKGELLGSIKLVGVGGAITGRDVDICVCDDLLKGFSDCTPTQLEKLYSWFQNILVPRLEPHSKLIVLGTRWAPISNNCPVLTANRGWTTHGDLKIGDYVYTPNGKPSKIIKVHPKVQVNNEFTFDTGESIICGDNHIWKVIYRSKEKLMTTHEIMSRKINIEIPTQLPRKKIKGISLIKASKIKQVEGNCITIDSKDGMYLIGRSLIPTHNSNDIIGRLQEEQAHKYKFENIKALKDDGTCIWKERYTPEFFKERQEEVGERVFQAQYQGQPLDEAGAFFQLDNLLFEEFKYHDRSICVRSWDLAYSDESKGDINDYSASIKMWKTPDGLYWITDLKNGQYGENIHNELKRTAYLDTPNTPILIETGTKGGASRFYYNDLKNIYLKGYNVKQSEPIGSKVDRALAFRDAIWDGKVVIDLDNNNREALIKQLNSFPLGKHDDIIDACSYAYNYLQDKKPIVKKLRAGKKRRVKL